MANSQQINSIGIGAYFPIHLTYPVKRIPKKDENGVIQRDGDGNIIYEKNYDGSFKTEADTVARTEVQWDSSGNPFLKTETDYRDKEGLVEQRVPKCTWFPLVGDMRLIKQNLTSLLCYHIGQRLRQEDYGTRIWECLEEPSTQTLTFMIRRFLMDSISGWEPRISAINCSAKLLPMGVLHIDLRFAVKGSPGVESLSFDYNPQTSLSYVSE